MGFFFKVTAAYTVFCLYPAAAAEHPETSNVFAHVMADGGGLPTPQQRTNATIKHRSLTPILVTSFPRAAADPYVSRPATTELPLPALIKRQ